MPPLLPSFTRRTGVQFLLKCQQRNPEDLCPQGQRFQPGAMSANPGLQGGFGSLAFFSTELNLAAFEIGICCVVCRPSPTAHSAEVGSIHSLVRPSWPCRHLDTEPCTFLHCHLHFTYNVKFFLILGSTHTSSAAQLVLCCCASRCLNTLGTSEGSQLGVGALFL